MNVAFLKCLGATNHLHVILAIFYILFWWKIWDFDTVIEWTEECLNSLQCIWLISYTYVRAITSLRHALYLWWALWFGVILIHIFFLLFIAVCVLWRQALKQSLSSKIVRGQHLWKQGEEWYWVEGDSELQCRSYKTSSTQSGTLEPISSIRCVLNGVRMDGPL